MKTSSKIAIAAAAVGAWLLAKKKGVISGIGRTIRNDFYDAIIESEDGNFRVEFSIIPGSGNVRAEIYQRTASYIDPKNYDPQRMVEWFKWGTEYGRDLRTAAIKAGKIVKAQGGSISFDELGVGKVDYSDFDEARIVAKNGTSGIEFNVYRGNGGYITVTAVYKGFGERYGFDWEYLSTIGEYKTLSGAIRAAKKYWDMRGIKYDPKDFEKL